MAKDYYKILGVDKNATEDEIKSAYRQLAKKYHPDLHPNDKEASEKFKECNEAYSVIGDKENRGKYDRGEMDFQGNGGANPFEGFHFTSASGFDDIFSDLFSGFMGGGGRRQSATPVGTDINCNIKLTFMEAALGVKKKVTFSRMEKCSDCKGTGGKDASSVKTCDKCGGSGKLNYTQQTLYGTRVTVGTCDKCGGSGQIVTDKCKTCNGKGVVSKNKVVTVEIPAGVEDQTARVKRGEGNACRQAGGMSGNLILSFMVEDSKVFKRNDLNLYAEIPVPYETSVSGGDIEIPTLNGMITQHISEGTANGTVFRVRGKGIHSEQGVGDLYITAKVEVPVGLSRTQKKSLADFEKELTLKNYPKRQEFLKNIEEMYKETAE